SEDELIYRDEEAPKMYHNASVTADGKYLIMEKASGTDGFETWFKPLDQPGVDFQPLFTGFSNKNSVVDHRDGHFYVLTDVNAPNYRLVRVPVADVDVENWVDIIPEKDFLLESVRTAGNKLFANYLENATNQVYVLDYEGTVENQVLLPGTGSVGGFGGEKDSEAVYYAFTSFIYPTTIFRYDLETRESDVFFASDLDFNPDDYVEKQVWYDSKDGTPVSMFIVHKKGI